MGTRKLATYFSVLFLMLLLIAGLVGACIESPAASPSNFSPSTSVSVVSHNKIILKLALQSSPTEPDALAIDDFAKCFNEHAEGKAEIVVYGNRSMGLSTQYLDMVRTGAVEMAELPLGLIEDDSPVLIAPSLPFLFNNTAASIAAKELMAEAVFHRFFEKKYNQKPIFWYTGSTYNLGSVNKSIKTIIDMKNMLIAAASHVQFSILNVLGASNANVVGPDLYDALEKKVVDAVLIPSGPAVKMNLSKVMHYWTVCEMHTSYGCVTINQEVFNNLTEDLKGILFEEGKKCGNSITERIIALEKESADQLRKSMVSFYILPDNERERWKQACLPIWEEYLQRAGADGEILLSIANEANKAYPYDLNP